MYKPNKTFMRLAIEEAIKGNLEYGKYPLGAVIIKDNEVIAKSYNGLPNNKDPTAHAEILAIKEATKNLKTRYLDGCILYSTNEPCVMCSGAIIWSNLEGVVYGANVNDLKRLWKRKGDDKDPQKRIIFIQAKSILEKSKPKTFVIGNFMREECLRLFRLYDKDFKR